MTGVVSLVASGVLVALAVWILGGFALRTAGAVLAVGGLFAAATTGSSRWRQRRSLVRLRGLPGTGCSLPARASCLSRWAAGRARSDEAVGRAEYPAGVSPMSQREPEITSHRKGATIGGALSAALVKLATGGANAAS
jgi:hypothetical protein